MYSLIAGWAASSGSTAVARSSALTGLPRRFSAGTSTSSAVNRSVSDDRSSATTSSAARRARWISPASSHMSGIWPGDVTPVAVVDLVEEAFEALGGVARSVEPEGEHEGEVDLPAAVVSGRAGRQAGQEGRSLVGAAGHRHDLGQRDDRGGVVALRWPGRGG